jgi:hypothetical protein
MHPKDDKGHSRQEPGRPDVVRLRYLLNMMIIISATFCYSKQIQFSAAIRKS